MRLAFVANGDEQVDQAYLRADYRRLLRRFLGLALARWSRRRTQGRTDH